jgi:hypothetical protein
MKSKGEKKPLFGSLFKESDFGGIDDDYFPMDAMRDGGFRTVSQHGSLFLNRYNVDEMIRILKKAGMIRQLSAKGFPEPVYEIFKDDQQVHYFRVFADENKDPSKVLVDLRLSEKRFIPEQLRVEAFRDVLFDMFVIEWLQTQNPKTTEFTSDRPQLPGQKSPGLGCLKYLMMMMRTVAPDISIDGFLDVPDHFHLAIMYSKMFHFFDPLVEGEVRAVLRDTEGHTLSDITWGAMTGTLVEKKSGEPFVYTPSNEIFPVSKRLLKYFSHKSYQRQAKESFKHHRYVFDADAMRRKRDEILKKQDISEL